jgi:hypothetical protein
MRRLALLFVAVGLFQSTATMGQTVDGPLNRIQCEGVSSQDQDFWMGLALGSNGDMAELAGDPLLAMAIARIRNWAARKDGSIRDVGATSFGLPIDNQGIESWKKSGLSMLSIYSNPNRAGFTEFQLHSKASDVRELQVNVWELELPSERPLHGATAFLEMRRSADGQWRPTTVRHVEGMPAQALGMYAVPPAAVSVPR